MIACTVHHILVASPVIDRRGRFFITHDNRFRTVSDQKRHTAAAAIFPVCVVALKGQSDLQLDLTIFRLFFEPQQYLPGPHIHAQSAAYPKLAKALLIELDQLIPDAFLDPLAAVVVFIIFEAKACRSMAGDGTGKSPLSY